MNETCTDLTNMTQGNQKLLAILSVYPKEVIDKLVANKEKLQAVMSSMSQDRYACYPSASVLTCNPETCPYAEVCVFNKNEVAPVGFECPVERKIVMELEADVVENLKIDRGNPIEMEMLWDLIDTKLLDLRASSAMKKESLLLSFTSNIGNGRIVRSETEVNPLLETKMDLKRLKHSIIDSFVATRRAKRKYGIEEESDKLKDILEKATGLKL